MIIASHAALTLAFHPLTVNTDLKGLTILLPQLLDSKGYTIYFVNTSNSTQIYAASQPFIIASGQVPSTAASASGAAASTLTATSANIPGPYTPFSTTATPTATRSGSASASSAASNDAATSHAHQLAMMVAAGVGAVAVGVLL
ncbi:hypothetical protein QFC24_003572 [Naganishia onofrii]|uniref:Uncharacterized protein n=1 Tax=Naganishia onofrii TaxID=1851511 RepID=A0ACC2XK99_9TREE|nr:hypothetical protein QFC24_003572 [Naganishia onofrii]